MDPSAPKRFAPDPGALDEAQLAELVQRMATRDAQALSRLYDLTAARVYATAMRISRKREVAEEVVCDVYHQAWREAARYDASRGLVVTWLLVVCRSRALDALRRTDKAMLHPDPQRLAEQPVDEGNRPEDLLQVLETRSRIHAALATLPAVQRQLVALAFLRGLTHSEIAGHMGMPLGTVKTHIRQALTRLKDHER